MITENSPEFYKDGKYNTESILAWANAKVEWSDGAFVDGDGKEHFYPLCVCWTLSWKFGSISLVDNYSKSISAERARILAALFIYLYTRGIEVSVALRCMEGYKG